MGVGMGSGWIFWIIILVLAYYILTGKGKK